MPQKVEISPRTIFITLGLIIGLQLLYNIRFILLQIFVALILMTALNPVVNNLENRKLGSIRINRVTAIALTYIIALSIVSLFVSIIAQPLAEQTRNLVNQMPSLLRSAREFGIDDQIISQQLSQLGNLSTNIVRVIGAIFSNILSVFTTLVIAFYLTLERKNLHAHLASFIGNKKMEKRIEKFIDRIEFQMGGWVRAQLILMVIVGVLNYIGFTILGLNYALPLAIFAGFLEIIPNIGPTIAAIPAALAGFAINPIYGIMTILWSIIVQQIENNILVPQVMAKNTGVKPLATIIGLLIGYTLAGVPGAILAVPAIIILVAVAEEFFADRWPYSNENGIIDPPHTSSK